MSDIENLIVVKNLEKYFGDNQVLKGIDLTVGRGEIISLIGQSGGGKSTLLRCLNLLEQPTKGSVTLLGQLVFDDSTRVRSQNHLVGMRRKIGMVFQQFNLFPHITAIENIMLPLVDGLKLSTEEAIARGEEVLDRVGMLPKGMAYPETLSGGQQQRVAIARTLALRPEVILFDEPTSSLDPESTGEVLSVMRELGKDGVAMVVATHEMEFASTVADRAVFMDQGLIVEQGPASQLIQNPREVRTRAFLKKLAREEAA